MKVAGPSLPWHTDFGVLSRPEAALAKARVKKEVAAEVLIPSDEPKALESLGPEKVHELFGISRPYDRPDGCVSSIALAVTFSRSPTASAYRIWFRDPRATTSPARSNFINTRGRDAPLAHRIVVTFFTPRSPLRGLHRGHRSVPIPTCSPHSPWPRSWPTTPATRPPPILFDTLSPKAAADLHGQRVTITFTSVKPAYTSGKGKRLVTWAGPDDIDDVERTVVLKGNRMLDADQSGERLTVRGTLRVIRHPAAVIDGVAFEAFTEVRVEE